MSTFVRERQRLVRSVLGWSLTICRFVARFFSRFVSASAFITVSPPTTPTPHPTLPTYRPTDRPLHLTPPPHAQEKPQVLRGGAPAALLPIGVYVLETGGCRIEGEVPPKSAFQVGARAGKSPVRGDTCVGLSLYERIRLRSHESRDKNLPFMSW
jgi:hypothetical protein